MGFQDEALVPRVELVKAHRGRAGRVFTAERVKRAVDCSLFVEDGRERFAEVGAWHQETLGVGNGLFKMIRCVRPS